jgi:hypothetical protein
MSLDRSVGTARGYDSILGGDKQDSSRFFPSDRAQLSRCSDCMRVGRLVADSRHGRDNVPVLHKVQAGCGAQPAPIHWVRRAVSSEVVWLGSEADQ